MAERSLKLKLQPGLLRWARQRAGLSEDELAKKMQVKLERVLEWERSGEISTAQVRKLAQGPYTPEGYLYLDQPADDSLPIADFRTIGDHPITRPSPNLLDTIYQMQRRQDWMREELLIDEADPLEFVGAFRDNTDFEDVADGMREALTLDPDWASGNTTWDAALRFLRNRIEEVGVLVFINGIVGNNTHRKLDPDEFRGLALIDEYAPLIFINNADYTSAQMFTIAHELAHIFIGAEGVSNFEALLPSGHATEGLCNNIAAEFLVPHAALEEMWETVEKDEEPYQKIARKFKVSVIVAARRTFDLGLINKEAYFQFYAKYLTDERRQKDSRTSGGNFWNNQNVRLGIRFGIAVARAVKEGRLLHREAYRLADLKGDIFASMPGRMGMRL